MGFTIELSVDIIKNRCVTNIKTLLSSLAEKYNSTSNYFIHEIEGHNNIINRNDCVHVVEFETGISTEISAEIYSNIINYIKAILQVKFIKLDTIYHDTGEINIIYASKRYSSTMSSHRKKSSKTNQPINYNKILELINKI